MQNWSTKNKLEIKANTAKDINNTIWLNAILIVSVGIPGANVINIKIILNRSKNRTYI